jgi:hypothetical protein
MARAQKLRKIIKKRGRLREAGRIPQKNTVRKWKPWKSNHNSVLQRRKDQAEEDQNYRSMNEKSNAKRPNSPPRMPLGKRRLKLIHFLKSYRVSIDIPAHNNMPKISCHKNERTVAVSPTRNQYKTSPKTTLCNSPGRASPRGRQKSKWKRSRLLKRWERKVWNRSRTSAKMALLIKRKMCSNFLRNCCQFSERNTLFT